MMTIRPTLNQNRSRGGDFRYKTLQVQRRLKQKLPESFAPEVKLI